jgi:hypothetical protein
MKKMTFVEVCGVFHKHNQGKNLTQFSDPNPLTAVVVFKAENWDRPYSEKERSYKFSSDNKGFIGAGGTSIFGDCLDGVDLGIRLDHYIYEWKVDYCYILE